MSNLTIEQLHRMDELARKEETEGLTKGERFEIAMFISGGDETQARFIMNRSKIRRSKEDKKKGIIRIQ